MRNIALAVLAVAVLAVGCTGGSTPGAGPSLSSSPNPKRSELVRRAALDRCPPSAAETRVSRLPDVTLPCLGAGPAVHVAGLSGPLVLNIWGSWCGPCQKETPIFADVYNDLKGRVVLLGVDTEDDPDSALDFAAHVRPRMRYPSVVDDDKSVLLGLHGPIAVPSTVFVRADGTVAHIHPGEYDSATELRADIDHYLGVSA